MEFKQITHLPSTVPAARKIPKRQKRRSVSAQMKWVRRFLRSGMSQVAFCREHNINLKTFGNWKRKFDQLQMNPSSCEASTTIQKHQALNLTFPNGIRIEASIDLSTLNHWFKELVACK